MKRRIVTKKVLVAAIGIATVSYAAACLDGTESSGNLLPPPDAASDAARDAREDVSSSGNLVPPPIDATSDVSVDANVDALPPPTDAGDGGD